MTRPNYDTNLVAAGLVNDTDVTDELQDALDRAASLGQPLLVPYGVYWITRTVHIPVGTRLFGEVWTRFAPQGPFFQDPGSPQPMFRVGNPGDVGVAQISDIMMTTRGPAPGAVLLEWNVQGANQGDSGIWDSHFRIGGAAGSLVDQDTCPKNTTMAQSPNCVGVHTLLRINANASVYAENVWGWVGDHNIDSGHGVNCYSARGLLVSPAAGPVWLYGTAMEHSYLYQYNLFSGSSASSSPSSGSMLLSILQTETPYYQPEFPLTSSSPEDPTFYPNQMHSFSLAATTTTEQSSGLRATAATVYGTAMYSFFDKWNSTVCGASDGSQPACQKHISRWDGVEGAQGTVVRIHNFNTHGAEVVLDFDENAVLAASTNNGFCSTVSVW
jgi:hypothetical protein